MDERDVATAFLRHEGEVLATLRGPDAPTYPDRWAAVSGYVEAGEEPVEAARREIREETGIADPTLVRSGTSLTVEAPEHDATFVVHPVLFDVAERTVEPGPEIAAVEWIAPTEFLRRETVPELWTAYRRVAPTVQSVAADDEHGAATLSIRALAVLRDRAGLLAAEGEPDREELDALGERLRRARPSMAVLRNRVNRALAEAGEDPADVEAAAIEGIAAALAADAEAAVRAAGLLEDERVLTLSRSGTVFDALAADTVAAVSVAESRPACEGIDVAEALAGEIDAPVTVHTDAAVAHVLASDRAERGGAAPDRGAERIDALLVGADAILPDGRVVNKAGTRGAAIAAAREGVPVYVAAATDKVTTREEVNLEFGDASAVYDGDAALDVHNPTFDVTPADVVEGIVTERGVVEPADVEAIAAELRALEPE